jgi:hypothetical protein
MKIHTGNTLYVSSQRLACFQLLQRFQLLMLYDEGAGKEWLSLEERNGFRGTSPPPSPERCYWIAGGQGGGQSLKPSRCDSEGERESVCKLVVGFCPLKVSRCERSG